MFKKILLSLLAIVVIFEEWLWDLLAAIGQWLSQLLHLEKFDLWLLNATPNTALLAFLIPLAIVTPFNILAVFLLSHGAIIEGILLEIAVKLIGTLLIARVFRLTKIALLTFGWVSSLYYSITRLLQWAHDLIHHTALYQLSIAIKKAVKIKINYWLHGGVEK